MAGDEVVHISCEAGVLQGIRRRCLAGGDALDLAHEGLGLRVAGRDGVPGDDARGRRVHRGLLRDHQHDSDERREHAQQHQRPVLPQQACSYLVYFHQTSSAALARVASSEYDKARKSPFAANRSLA
jgi:hypothetical protein